MGLSSSSLKLGSRSTAAEVASFYSNGQAEGFLKGKVAVITGGNSGIGLETCKALTKEGCRVIIGSRDVDSGKKAVEKEVQSPGNGKYVVSDISNIVVKQLNLESLKSIKSFAEEVLAEERIDFLICNAGVMALPKLEYTENGWEKQVGVNHYGHFHLTSLLKDKMMAQKHPSRIVVVSSIAHTMGPVTVSDLHFKNGRKYEAWVAYGQSKLSNILFTKSLADKLQNTQVQAVCLHPGVIPTKLSRHMNIITGTIFKYFITDKTIPQGAATTMYACLSPDLDSKIMSGSYLKDCAVEIPSLEAQDLSKTLRTNLWDLTETDIKLAVSKM
eukprot:CAMPEP_0119036014 /NCGR_PEP_ID=MMETSP1177-20130426/3384_1 /TAXON_ID=2985 /ORGANISM="Ochromonas sp, Strain CCMP1899" /LENGTH=328 /DNA_ID=CAMNT_0006995115 /DNA_START=88 /DNA_END=1074 /DNA_ORIENTATION=+